MKSLFRETYDILSKTPDFLVVVKYDPYEPLSGMLEVEPIEQ